MTSGSRLPSLLPYPPPYRCWLALCSDPDATTPEAWAELHEVVWGELALPFADSFFISNLNEALPGQVNLDDQPEILAAHPHDTMHTWGDYTLSSRHRFTRADAERGLARLKALGAAPLVWTDHSSFTGNLMHRATARMTPEVLDASGHSYPNMDYTLDLLREAGVRYVWDGEIESRIWGQDRRVSAHEWYARGAPRPIKGRLFACAHALLRPVAGYLNPEVFSYDPEGNRQYRGHRFPDSQRFYVFRRFGRWGLADIDGLGELIAPDEIESFIRLGGTAIVYTHLGKRRAGRVGGAHVPPQTRAALRHLARRHADRAIMLSSTARLLDYLVLRDHARVGPDGVDFVADGIRFASLTADDLAPHSFGLRAPGGGFAVTCEGREVPHSVERLDAGVFRISFPKTADAPAIRPREAAGALA